jgi:peptidoglycan/LPS O-acetylase OafA/YrhL
MVLINPQTKVTYLDSLTSVRDIGAIAVVIQHFAKVFFPEWRQKVYSYTSFIQNSYLWVNFFFVLNGFILAHVYRVHWPLQNFLREFWKIIFHHPIAIATELTFNQTTGIIVILLGFVILCSTFTYYWVELPIRKLLKKDVLLRKFVTILFNKFVN